MKYGKKLLILPLFLISLCLIIFATSYAQTPTPGNYDVTVNPIFFDLTANPGDTLSTKVRIRNNTTSPLPIKLSVKKMSGDLNGNLTLTDDNSDGSLSWITFTSNKITLNPLEWTDVPFTITIPKSAAYGYYFAVTFTQDNTSPLKRTGAAITGAAAVPILLNVKKEGAKTEGKLIKFTTDSNFYEYPPIKFLTTFENTGNVHIRPTGTIFIKDFLGRDVTTLAVNQTQGTILPNAAKTFESSWDDGFITVEPKMQYGQPVLDKNGKQETQLNIRWDKLPSLRIGKYTASEIVVLSTATKDIPFEMQTSFFVFPWKIIGAITIIILLLAYIIIYREIQVRKLKRELKALQK